MAVLVCIRSWESDGHGHQMITHTNFTVYEVTEDTVAETVAESGTRLDSNTTLLSLLTPVRSYHRRITFVVLY